MVPALAVCFGVHTVHMMCTAQYNTGNTKKHDELYRKDEDKYSKNRWETAKNARQLTAELIEKAMERGRERERDLWEHGE